MKKYAKELYSKEVLLKAAFAFTDSMYIHLDVDNDYYMVVLKSKKEEAEELLYKKFENELIAQATRLLVSNKTKNIREMIIARALSSTMIDLSSEEEEVNEEFDANDILTDWFEGNE